MAYARWACYVESGMNWHAVARNAFAAAFYLMLVFSLLVSFDPSRAAIRPAIHASTSSSTQPVAPPVCGTGPGKSPERTCRQMVVLERPVSSRTLGSRTNRGRRTASMGGGDFFHLILALQEDQEVSEMFDGGEFPKTPSPILAANGAAYFRIHRWIFWMSFFEKSAKTATQSSPQRPMRYRLSSRLLATWRWLSSCHPADDSGFSLRNSFRSLRPSCCEASGEFGAIRYFLSIKSIR